MLVTVQVPWCHPPSGLGPRDLMFHRHCSRLIPMALVPLRNNSMWGQIVLVEYYKDDISINFGGAFRKIKESF